MKPFAAKRPPKSCEIWRQRSREREIEHQKLLERLKQLE